MLAAEWVGQLLTLLAWGLAADRFGERWALAGGLGGCAACLAAVPATESMWPLIGLLTLAGALGASTSSASGRAIMHWFGAEERGLALGVRQTAIPIGGIVGAAVLPQLSVDGAFLFLAAFCLAGALGGAAVIREGARVELPADAVAWTLRDRRLWTLCVGSGLYLVAQIAINGFIVLFLHDERGMSKGAAAAVLGAIQVGAAALRIGGGRWSDLRGTRLVPLRLIGLATFVTVAAVAALLSAPLAVLIPAIVVAGSLAMAWNGLSFTAAAELAGHRRSGAAIGLQQTVIGAVGAGVPVVFALGVSTMSWHAAYAAAAVFPLAGWLALRRLGDR